LMQQQTMLSGKGLTTEPTSLYLTQLYDGFSWNAIWGLTSTLLPHFFLDFLHPFTKLCMVDGVRHKFFTILHWEMWFLNCLTIMSYFGTKGWTMTNLLLEKTEMLTLPTPITNLHTYCGLFQNRLPWMFFNIFTFILPLFQLFFFFLSV